MITIGNCAVRFKQLCPMRWENLVPTADETVRLCETCWRQVFLCTTDAEARYQAMEGHCVALAMPDSDGSMWIGEPMPDGRDGSTWNDL
jgi:hypothetical protein